MSDHLPGVGPSGSTPSPHGGINNHRSISLVGARGGSGTSTVALAAALRLPGAVRLAANTDDLLAMSGLMASAITPDLELVEEYDSTPGLTIIDEGCLQHRVDRGHSDNHQTFLVLRGPCYLALRSAQDAATTNGATWNGLILIREEGRALQVNDVEAALNARVKVVLDIDPTIARVIDAGLFVSRLPKTVHAVEGLL